VFLTSAQDRDEYSLSHPGRFTPVERAAGTHWVGGGVGPRPGLDAVAKSKNPCSCRESNSGHWFGHCSDWTTAATVHTFCDNLRYVFWNPLITFTQVFWAV